jgi:transcriptional regulator with XRE-family HTH domain
MSKSFGNRLREIRESKELTQRQFAKSLNIDAFYVSRLENNRINPTLSTIRKLADALGVGVRDFFPGVDAALQIETPRLDRDLKKIVTLWSGLTEDHKHLLLRFIEHTHKIDTREIRTRRPKQ